MPRISWRLLVIIALAAAIVAFGIVRATHSSLQGVIRREAKVLTAPSPLPATRLTLGSGETLLLPDDLRGKYALACFFFTTCPGPCYQMNRQLARLQQRLAGSFPTVRLLSISVDPEHDTPQALRAYAARQQADENRWLFLTGERDAIRNFATNGCKLVVDDVAPDLQAANGPILHSAKIVLIGPDGTVLRYIDSFDTEGVPAADFPDRALSALLDAGARR